MGSPIRGDAPSRAKRTALVDALTAMERAGKPVTCLRLCSNGDVLLLTESPPEALPEADGDWVDLAGETAVSRA